MYRGRALTSKRTELNTNFLPHRICICLLLFGFFSVYISGSRHDPQKKKKKLKTFCVLIGAWKSIWGLKQIHCNFLLKKNYNFSGDIFPSIFGHQTWIGSGLTRKPGFVSGYNDYHMDPQDCLLCIYSWTPSACRWMSCGCTPGPGVRCSPSLAVRGTASLSSGTSSLLPQGWQICASKFWDNSGIAAT